jgi:hypothetical protein
LKASSTCQLNPNYVQTAGLQNYWHFCSSLTDLITNSTLYNGVNVSFTADRSNNSNSALSLLNGSLQAPSGIYFTGEDFTVMAWVYIRSFNPATRIIDFGNGAPGDSVVCSVSFQSTGLPYLWFNMGANESQNSFIKSNQPLVLNQWQHLSIVFSSSTLNVKIYINGMMSANGTATFRPSNVLRSSNLIGGNNWPDLLDLNADLDELKIFNVA